MCALREGLISQEAYLDLMSMVKEKLISIGIIDLNLKGTHILLSFNKNKELITDEKGKPVSRICNFELLKSKYL